MILNLIGLILSFGASVYLTLDTLFNFGKPSSIITPIIEQGNITKNIRLKRLKSWGFEQVKITPEEIKLIVVLVILSLGFLFQLLDAIPLSFWEQIKDFI